VPDKQLLMVLNLNYFIYYVNGFSIVALLAIAAALVHSHSSLTLNPLPESASS
jgi:hypothetical protein